MSWPPPELGEALDPTWYARLFDALGARYDDLPFTGGEAQEVRFLVDELGLEPPARVLDVGCGSGRHAVELAARGFTVTGVDLSLRQLERGLARARRRGVAVNLLHADARELPAGGGYDAAVSLCEGAFGLLEDDAQNRRVLERMRGALRPGGRLALNALHRAWHERHRDELALFDPATGWSEQVAELVLESGRQVRVRVRDRSFAPGELARELEATGFQVTAVYGASPGGFGRHPPRDEHRELLALGVAT